MESEESVHTIASQDIFKVQVDDSYIRESVLSPQAKVVAGYQPIMPSFQGQVSEEQLQMLIAYIKSIGTAPAANAEATKPGTAAPAMARPPILNAGANAAQPPSEKQPPEQKLKP